MIEKKRGKMTKRNLTKGRSMKARPLLRNPERKYIIERAKYDTRLLALHTHASQLSSAEKIDAIVKCALDAMELTLGFEHAYFLLVEKGSLQIKGSRGRRAAFSAQPLQGRGTTVKAATTKTTLRISDTRKEPSFVDPKGYDWTGPPTVLSELVVPVFIDAEVVAVLCVDSTRLDNFTEDDQRLLEILASHVGSAYRRLNYERKLIALHKHAQQLASATSLDGIIKYTLDAIESPLGVELADFYVVDTEKECLRLVGLRGWSPSFSELSLRGPGFTVMAVNSQQTVRIADISKEKGYVDAAGRSGKAVSTTRLSELAVPVIVEGKTVALLNVESSQLNAFNDEDQRLLETLAGHVASELARLSREEALRRQTDLLKKTFNSMTDAIFVLDAKNPPTILECNETATRIFGYANAEMLGETTDFLHASDESLREFQSRLFNAVAENRLPFHIPEYRMKRKDGILFPSEHFVSPLIDDKGVRTGWVSIVRDITERTHMEKALLESVSLHRATLESTAEGILVVDMNGKVSSFNQSFAELWHIPVNLLETRDDAKLLQFVADQLEDPQKFVDKVQELYSKPEKESFDVLRFKDGREFERYSQPQRLGTRLVGRVWSFRDVTERKRLEEELKQYSLHLEELVAERTGELRQSEEKYRDLFEACPVSLWEEDFSAVKQFLDELRQEGVSDFGAYLANHPEDIAKCAALVKVLNMNKATLDFYDAKSVDEIIGGLSGVLTEQSNRAFVDELVALVQGKKYYEAEFENITLRGETKHCNVICAVVPGYEQSLAKVLICIIDLTPQKKLEAELVKSQRLAAIGETAAMVGHDLRNPLQGIAGALHLLKQESLTTEERKEMLQLIEKSIHYSDAIIKDLSDYSAEIQLKLAEATPKSITRDAIGAVRVPQNVRVQDLSEDQPTLRVDPDMMKRVFINLIENAIDAMPQGGTLTVSSKKSDGNVEIALTDTGSGIPDKAMESLWKPLQTTKAKGMGLGLAICKRIIDAHGGSISVKSEVGRGTTLTIQLPIRPVEVKQK